MDHRIKSVLRGCLDNLPTLNSRLVRIFLSSTFTDTREERNILIEEVYPKLKSYCKENYGLEFQVVDMRWGVPEEASDDHLATELCLQEIYNCQKLSTGPNFVTLLNQRHGYHPLQPIIKGDEFQMLVDCLRGLGEDISLLETWYKEDQNASPPVYVLQPISSIIPEYKNKTKKSGEEWSQVSSAMRKKLKIASQKCFEDGTLKEEEKHKYFISVTEEEIINGILKSPGNPDESCLCFVRIIEDIENHLGHKNAWRFIDMTGDKVDEESQTVLKKLRDEKVTKKFLSSAVTKSMVQWSENGGISKEDHKDYLQEFGNMFYSNVKKMLDNAVTKATELSKDDLYIEVLQHLSMAKERCEMFHGREDILEKATTYLSSDASEPFTIYGSSGSGKTSIMAEIARKVQFAYNKNAIVLLRFLGTSPDSSNVRRLLHSLCEQILFNMGKDRKNLPQEYDELVSTFHDLLQNYNANAPLVILLDSLDQLSSEHSAYKLKWLPRKCSKHVRIILSTYVESEEIITVLRALFSRSNFIHVPKLGEELSLLILKHWLSAKNRQLTQEQFSIVEDAFTKCSLPLYVKLVFEIVSSWRSYTQVNINQVVFTVKEIIEDLYRRLEVKHGKIYVSRAFAYLTASKSGLSEMELEDIMSLDDSLLTDVFRFHIPPIRRVPSVLWSRLRYDIDSYLVDKEVDEMRVSFWYHRQFLEAAEERYLKDETFKKEIHSNMADFYLETWYDKPKPFKYTSDQMKRLGLTSADSSADRKVSPQPLRFSYTEGQKVHYRYNKRKLNKMPFHLMMAGRGDELSNLCLFNYSFLVAKVSATSVLQVLADFVLAGYENSFLQKILETSRATIQRFPRSLAFEISGHLLPFLSDSKASLEKRLVEECVEVSSKDNAPLPYLTCYNIQSDALRFKLENHKLPYNNSTVALSRDSEHLLSLAEHNRILLWDLTNGDLERDYRILDHEECKLNIMEYSFERNCAYFASIYQKIGNPLVIVDLDSGDVTNTLWLEKTYPGVGMVHSLKFVFTSDKVFCLFVGHSADCFDLQKGKHLHHFDFVADEMTLSSSEKLIVYHLKATNKYVVRSTISYDLLSEFEVSSAPLEMILTPRGTEAVVIFKDSDYGSIVNIDPLEGAPGTCLSNIPSTNGKPFQRITISVNGEFFILKTEDGFLVWNYKRNRVHHKFVIPSDIIPGHRVLDFTGFLTPDNKFFVVGYECHIVLWDAQKGNLLNAQMMSRRSPICSTIMDHSGEILITTSKKNNGIMLWKLASLMTSDLTFSPLSVKTSPRYMVISETGKVAVIRGSVPSEVAIFDLVQGKIRLFLTDEYDVLRPKITPDGLYAVLREYESEQTIKVWSTDSGKIATSLPLSSVHVTHYICSSSKIAVYTKDSPKPGGNISIWSIPEGKLLHTLALGHSNIGDMILFFGHADDQMVISKQNDGDDITITDMLLIDMKTGNEIYTIPNVKAIRTQPLRHKESVFVTVQIEGNSSQTLIVDMKNKKILRKHTFDPMPCSMMSLSMDGRYGIDRHLNLYNLDSMKRECQFDQEEMETIRNQEKIVGTAPKMMPNGRFAIWVDIKAGLIKVGSVTSKEIQSVCAVHSIPMHLDVSSLGLVVVGCEDGRIMILQMPDEQENVQAGFLKSVQARLKHHSVKLLKGGSSRRQKDSRPDKGNKKSSVCEIV